MLTYDEYMKDQLAFCQALDDLKKEVAGMRSLKANEVATTIRQLEPRIPELESIINTKTAYIKHLDSLIATKQKQSEYDEKHWQTHYEDLETKLNNAHENSIALFKSKDEVYTAKDKAYQDKEVDLQSREESLTDGIKKHAADKNAHDLTVEMFEQAKRDNEYQARKIIDELNGHINEANAEKMKQKELTAQLEEQSAILAKATKEAQDIIKKINDAQIILDEAKMVATNNEVEKSNIIKEQEKLNELSAKNRAEIQRILNDQDALDGEKRKLFQRENNIKVIEASLNKG